MKPWNKFRPYRRGDLQEIWKSLRPEDYQEYSAINFTDPELIETVVLGGGGRLMTWECEEGPVAMLGVGPSGAAGVAGVWSIASTLAVPRWRFAVRHTARLLDELGDGYLLLSNFKDTRNTSQINWLRRQGFIFFRTEMNFMGSGVPFHQFVRIVK